MTSTGGDIHAQERGVSSAGLAEPSLVSVVLPTFDRPAWLMEAIDSVLSQTYSHCEVLVADDGSGAETTRRLQGRNDPRVRHLALAHTGLPSVSRNRALAAAKGEFIAFLDDDDVWEPVKLERQLELFRLNERLGLVFTNARAFGADGPASAPMFGRRADPGAKDGAAFNRLLTECFIHPSTVMVRKSALDRVGGFDETLSIAEDLELWLRLAAAVPVGYIADPLVRIREHPASNSRERAAATWRNVVTILTRVRRSYDLSWSQRLRVRRAVARAHAWLGILSGGRSTRDGRSHLLRSLRLNPVQRRAWIGLLGSASAMTVPRP